MRKGEHHDLYGSSSQPGLDTNGIVGAGSTEPGGEFPDSIGPGLYKFTLPDGQQVIVDQYGNIIG